MSAQKVNKFATRIRKMMPDQQTIMLASRQRGDNFSTAVAWKAQRQPRREATSGVDHLDADMMSQPWRLFLNGQTVYPVPGDQFTDESGNVWQIGNVSQNMGQNVFNLDCVLNV